jgi:tetratricopeptide (TPR) repeat protein
VADDPSARFCDACGSPLSMAAPVSPSTSQIEPAAPPAMAPLPMPSSFGAGRYQVRRFLGEGGRKRVFQAYDSSLDRDVALATIKTEGLDDAGLLRVRREAQAMGSLGDHPHVVTVYDIGEEDGQPYIVSQYMAGGSVDDLLQEAEDRRLPVPEAVRLAEEISQALEHAHARGIVHRDVKPANVWLTEGGAAKLGDFGLATAADHSRLTTEGMVVGTVAYMAPEQALGREVDARADLYALGAFLYECLTGRPPFVGGDAVTILSQQLNAVPMAPFWHNPDVPRALGTLVMELLAKTPDERPGGAAEVRRRLLEIAAAPPESVPEAPPVVIDPARHSPRLDRTSRLIGRTAELAALKAAVEAAVEGRGSLVLVAGEPGMGKTRLVEEAGVYARLRGAQVLVGHCYETESALPYLPFVEAIRSYVATQSAEALREELAGGASDVAKLVSEIRSRLPDLPSAPRHDAEEERYRLFESVSSFLANASGSHPIVLVLDDLHFADTPTLRLLQHLTRHLAESRLLVLGTYDEVVLHGRHPLAQVLVELRREHRYERIALRSLSVEEVGQVVVALAEDNLELAPGVIKTLHHHTEGNPFFVEEVIRHLLETGGVYSEAGRWAVDPAAVEELAVPQGVRDLIEGRLSRLSDACRDVLTQAAVLGRQFDFATLGRMTGLGEDALLDAVEEALRAQVIAERKAQHGQEAVYAFTRAVLRQILTDELSRPRRQRLHRRAAEAIEAVHCSNIGPHLGALALHYRQLGAGEAGKAIDYSVRAGEAAMAVFAYEEAVGHWEAALELDQEVPDAYPASAALSRGSVLERGEWTAHIEDRAHLLERLGDLKYVTGLDYRGSTRCLERVLHLYEELGDTERVAQTHSRLGRNLATGTSPSTIDVPRALAHYRAAEAILAEGPARAALGYVHVGLALASIWGMRTGEGLAASERALELAEKLGHDRLWVTAAAQRGHHLIAHGQLGEGMRLAERAWEGADRSHHVVAAFSATWIAAVWSFRLFDPEETGRWCRRELAAPRQPQGSREILLDFLARAHAQSGELAEARRVQERAGRARFTAPYLGLWEGDWEQAAALWTKQRQLARRTGNRWAESVAAHWLAIVKRQDGDFPGAEALLQDALSLAGEGGNVPGELTVLAELALLLADAGRPKEASPHLDRCRELLGGEEDWRGATGRVALAEAAALVAEGLVEVASERFHAAIEVFHRFSLPWDEAEAWHRWGRARLDAGDRPGALERLSQSLELYQRHGAGRRWVERVLSDKLVAQGVAGTGTLASIDMVAAAALDERPDLAPHTAPDGTVTLLFSDIEGSTASNERLGDRRWLEVLHAHNRIVREEVAAHGGFEVKSQGDGFMVAFSSARRGLECAIGIQRALNAYATAHPEEACGSGSTPAR